MKSKKSLRFSEKELSQLLQNQNIKCSDSSLKMIDLSQETVTPIVNAENKSKKKTTHSDNNDIKTYLTKIATCSYSIEETKDSLYLEFDGLKLMPFNQLAQAIQYRPHMLYQYKKALKSLFHCVCVEKKIQFIVEKDESIQLLLYREAERLIDNDTMSISFKYLIDNLRYENIISEDNPTVIKDIQCFQNKSKTPKIAMLIKKVTQMSHLTSLEEFKKNGLM